MSAAGMDAPECPVCLETLTAPILQCQGGHSLCSACSSALAPPICPICRKPMTAMRNWTLEDIIAKAAAAAAAAARGAPARAVRRACANAAAGCGYVFTAARDADDHAKECIFRDMLCPVGAAFNNCFWIGKLKQMMDHCKQKHPANCKLVPGAETEVRGVRSGTTARNVWLAAQGNMHFIVTMRTDAEHDAVGWTVQHIGSKKNANLYVYEIHVVSKQDPARRTVFSDRCCSDAEPAAAGGGPAGAAAAAGAGGCAWLPLRLLPRFAQEDALAFRFTVRKMPAVTTNIATLQIV